MKPTRKKKLAPKTSKPNANAATTGLRYNGGKTRHDLLEPFAIDQLAKVFTRGSIKYAPHNWLKGMPWSTVIACAKRHINAFERGEDYDHDPNCAGCQQGNCDNHTGLLHAAHAAWNLMAIVSYYKHAAKHDDRLHHLMPVPKIGLDIDGLLCDWDTPWAQKFKHPIPKHWNFSYSIKKNFSSFTKKELEKFYLNLPRKVNPDTIPFEPHCYITSRSVPTELTMQWLEKNGFACAPVYSVGFGQSKVEVALKAGIDVFADDSYANYMELNKAGILCYLYDAPHNQRYNVGYRRIKSLNELVK